METIKTFVLRHFNSFFYITLLMSTSLFLLMIRLKMTHSFFFLFLAWNLFLALIPFGISFWLTQRKELSKFGLLTGSIIWLLFLPNAPYIVTDFIHLQHSESMLGYDTLMIGMFAIFGIYLYVSSVLHMSDLTARFTSEKWRKLIFFALPFLVGLGIYFGRFLRWNSWDLLQRPQLLLKDLFEIIRYPGDHTMAWFTTMGFGIFLYGLYVLARIKARNLPSTS